MNKKVEHYYKSLLSHLNGEVRYHKGNVMVATQSFKNNVLNNSYGIGKKGYGKLVAISNKISNERKSLEAERELYEKDRIAFLEKHFEEELSNMDMGVEERMYEILINNKDNGSKMSQRDIEGFLMSYNEDYANYMKKVEQVYAYGSKEYIQKEKGAIDFFLESAKNDLQIKKNVFMEKLDAKYVKKFKKSEKSINRKDFMFKSIKEKAMSIEDYMNQKIDKNKSKYSDLEKNQSINREAHENRKEYARQTVISTKNKVIDKAENVKDIIVNIDAKKVSPINMNINKDSYIYQSGKKGIESLNKKANVIKTDAKILGGLASGFVKEKTGVVKDKANTIKNGLLSKSKSFAKKMHMTKENGSLKTLEDYKKGANKLINGYKDKVIDKAENVYLNGLYAKDKVVHTVNDKVENVYLNGLYAKDKVVDAVIDKAEDVYINGLEVKDNVMSKVNSTKSIIANKANEVKNVAQSIDTKKISPFSVNVNKDSYTYKAGRGMKRAIASLGIKGKDFIMKGKEVIVNNLEKSKEKEKTKDMEGLEK